MPVAQIDEVLAPEYLDGLQEWPLEKLRARRDRAEEVEFDRSYLRRMVQGRLDIVSAVRSHRTHGDPTGDLSQLIEELPTILGDRVHAPGTGRLPVLLTPGELDSRVLARLEAILPSHRLADVPSLSDDELEAVGGDLEQLERSVSVQRREVHAVIGHLEDEIVRRYQTGEASPDDLLP